jgi:hypothetical protein
VTRATKAYVQHEITRITSSHTSLARTRFIFFCFLFFIPLQLEMDSDQLVYVAVVTARYPTRVIFRSESATSTSPRLMREFRQFVAGKLSKGDGAGAGAGSGSSARDLSSPAVKGLKKSVEPFLKSLAAKFDDLESIDKLAAAAKKVAEVKQVMASNIAIATERDGLLSNLEDKSERLSESARAMFKASSAAKRKACCRHMKCVIIAVVCGVAAAAGIVLGLNYGVFHWWE